jgi:hypothetical protein
MFRIRFILAAAAAAVLSGCGGGGGESSAGSDASDQGTLVALNATNLVIPSAPGMLKRWDLPIPVKLNGEPRAIAAVDEIERQLGATIFDRTTIAATPNNLITRGLIVSVGTSVGPPGGNPAANCGSVGPTSTGETVLPPSTVLSNPPLLGGRNFINLDGPQCIATLDVAIHEFGHALGMFLHFQGFGDGPPISALFWRVLKTIYANPVGTLASNVVLP